MSEQKQGNNISNYLTKPESNIGIGSVFAMGTMLRTGMIFVAFPIGMLVLFYGSKHPEISIQMIGSILISALVVTYIILLVIRYSIAKMFDRNSK